jgi:rRNA-processing protein EBP2
VSKKSSVENNFGSKLCKTTKFPFCGNKYKDKMVMKSKLKMALAADKGVDFKKLKQNKKQQAATKEKSKKNEGQGKKVEEEWEDVDEDSENEVEDGGVKLDGEESDDGSEEEAVEPMEVCYGLLPNGLF